MIVILTSLIRQRISVPELIKEKSKNYLILFSCLVSVISLIGFTFFQEKTFNFSKTYLKLTDNILFFSFLLSSFSICILTFILLEKIDNAGIKKDSKYLNFKKIILFIMFVNLVLYLSCLIIISLYQPYISIEKLFMSLLIGLKEVNSILFIFNYLFFILTLKYDLFYVHLNLQIRPDIEYFFDSDENFK